MIAGSRGLRAGRKQCCDILGWTTHKAVRDGLPVAERPTSQGSDDIVFMGDVIRWLVKQELQAAGHETEGHYPRFAALAA